VSGSDASDDPRLWPEFCCAILRDGVGRYLLEKRPLHEDIAPGKLACFGGGRAADEHPDACIRRELREELGWEAGALERCVLLLGRNGRVIGWFYRGAAPSEPGLVMEVGVEAVWASWEELAALPVGRWNMAALRGEREGVGEVVVEE
jgi:8-oxo-dGTP pyrophosphatase MutT (NUDIX family)